MADKNARASPSPFASAKSLEFGSGKRIGENFARVAMEGGKKRTKIGKEKRRESTRWKKTTRP